MAHQIKTKLVTFVTDNVPLVAILRPTDGTMAATNKCRLRARAALEHFVVRAASCGSPGPLVPAQVTLTHVAPVATIADGNARSMPTAL